MASPCWSGFFYLLFELPLTSSVEAISVHEAFTRRRSHRRPQLAQMTPKTQKRKWATAKDWDAHREIIGRLYRNMELEGVMTTMEQEYHFYST